ncbi:MAG: type IV pilin [Methanocorpusculum sp.]|nr:type IV pilin [Methanocorpusculum sp.]
MIRSDEGVSPVIATILIIALTVIMIAVAGAAFMGMSGGVNSAKIVALSGEAGTAASPVYIDLLGGGA